MFFRSDVFKTRSPAFLWCGARCRFCTDALGITLLTQVALHERQTVTKKELD